MVLDQIWQLAVSNPELVFYATMVAAIFTAFRVEVPVLKRYTLEGLAIIGASIFYLFAVPNPANGIENVTSSIANFFGIGLGVVLILKERVDIFK